MCNNNEFYFCEHCGNLIDMIHDAAPEKNKSCRA